VNIRFPVLSAALLAAAGFVINASAQEVASQGVRLELAQASSGAPSQTSTAGDSTTTEKQVSDSSSGPDMKGTSAAGQHGFMSTVGAPPSTCVGPVSYCNIYFGS
jgi:hypothetical protein